LTGGKTLLLGVSVDFSIPYMPKRLRDFPCSVIGGGPILLIRLAVMFWAIISSSSVSNMDSANGNNFHKHFRLEIDANIDQADPNLV
jgi:hypothetical protein